MYSKENPRQHYAYSGRDFTSERIAWARKHDAYDCISAYEVTGEDNGPQWKDGKPIIKLPSGDFYQGDFCKEHFPHSDIAIFYYGNKKSPLYGSWYEGKMVNGEAQGIGKRIWRKDCKIWKKQKVFGEQL